MASVTIGRAANGFTLRMQDPAIVKANAKRDLSVKNTTPYRNPTKSYVFTKVEDLQKFLTENLEKALPAEDFDGAFDSYCD